MSCGLSSNSRIFVGELRPLLTGVLEPLEVFFGTVAPTRRVLLYMDKLIFFLLLFTTELFVLSGVLQRLFCSLLALVVAAEGVEGAVIVSGVPGNDRTSSRTEVPPPLSTAVLLVAMDPEVVAKRNKWPPPGETLGAVGGFR